MTDQFAGMYHLTSDNVVQRPFGGGGGRLAFVAVKVLPATTGTIENCGQSGDVVPDTNRGRIAIDYLREGSTIPIVAHPRTAYLSLDQNEDHTVS